MKSGCHADATHMKVPHCISVPEVGEGVVEPAAEFLQLVHGLVGEDEGTDVAVDDLKVLVDLKHGLPEVPVPPLLGALLLQVLTKKQMIWSWHCDALKCSIFHLESKTQKLKLKSIDLFITV